MRDIDLEVIASIEVLLELSRATCGTFIADDAVPSSADVAVYKSRESGNGTPS